MQTFTPPHRRISLLTLAAVVLILVPKAGAQNLIGGRYIWDGSDSGLWAEAANWAIGRSPTAGSDLTFPSSAFWHTTVNNYAAGTSFDLLNYSGAGYQVFGNALTLTEGITATHGAGTTMFGLDITLGADATFTAQNADATLTLGGWITLASSYTASFAGAGLVQVSNAVRRAPGFGGGVAIIKDGDGTTLLTKSNDLSGGQVWVRAGTLKLAHNLALGDAGSTIVLEAGTLALAGNLRLDSGPISLAGTVRSDLGANVISDTISLSGSNAVFAVPNSLTVSGVVAGATGFTLQGGGTLRLAANNTYSGPTLLNEGLLIADGLQPGSPILLNGGTLNGRGTVGPITSLIGGGVIDATSITSTQTCGGLELNGATTYRVAIVGASPGPRVGQFVVNGTVNLGGSALAIQFIPNSTSPLPGDAITILRNDGVDAIVGTFADLPEGTITNLGTTVSRLICRVSYAGGDGNDVALTVMPDHRVWDGGNNAYWNESANWDPAIYPPKPGDELQFPSGAARLNNTNNLGLNTPFKSIAFTGDGYTLNGNQIILEAGITAAPVESTNRVGLAIRLQTNQTFVAGNGAALLLLTNLDTRGHELTLAGEGEHRVSGTISGSGSLAKSGSGVATLSSSNTYAGPTEVREGTLLLARNYALGLTSTGTVVLAGGNLAMVPGLNVPEPLTLVGGLQLNSATNGTGVWSGPIILQGATPRFTAETSTLVVSGLVSGAGSFTKQGGGTLVLSADNTYTGTTVLDAGALMMNGAQPQSFVQLNGGQLGGVGIVGQVVASGPGLKILSPGAGIGVLTTSNLLMNSFTRLELDLNGTSAGVTHDQLRVRGTISLGNCQLAPHRGAALSAGMAMRILDNDGVDPVMSTFAGLPEGAVITATNGLFLGITYRGGDGNDVELRVLNPPPSLDSIMHQTTGFIQIQGHGVPNLLYTLEASTNLQAGSWSPITADLVDANGLFELIDVDSTNHPIRFYRVVSP